MSAPTELAWIVPVVFPFLIGLLVGVIVKESVKLIFPITALIILLVAAGYLSLAFVDIFDKAMEYLPSIIRAGRGSIDVLPYSTTAFIVGLVLGLWRG